MAIQKLKKFTEENKREDDSNKQKSLDDFLSELANECTRFDDFIDKIIIWIGIESAFEIKYFQQIIENAKKIKGKITWKKLGYGRSKYDNAIRKDIGEKLKKVAIKNGFSIELLSLVQSIVEYQECESDRPDTLIIEEEQEILRELDGISNKHIKFKNFLGDLVTICSDFDDLINRISIWIRLENEKEKESLKAIIYKAATIQGEKITWQKLGKSSDYRSIRAKVIEKRKQVGLQMTLLIDIIVGIAGYKEYEFAKEKKQGLDTPAVTQNLNRTQYKTR